MAEVITEDNTREDDRNRKFYDISFEDETGLKSSAENELIPDENLEENEKLLKYIADSEIGNQEPFITPFGTRRVVYCDYTASGRSLSFIEQFIHDHVLNEYGNTHTTNTVTALQTTLFRSESRDYIKSCVNAGELDCLIFVGSGCTGAVHKLINALDFKRPPIVIVSPFEHHSNLLPWREAMADIVYANEAADGSIDLDDLETKLRKFESENTRVKIGTFCAASNVTGILQDVDRISILLHRYGFLSFWDYATAAAYVKIDMNPFAKDQEHSELAYKDAIFFSTHKFVGGPQTPGILVAKKKLFNNRVPNGCGGGTVFFVTKYDHRYLKNDEMREEGGTPAIIESIRAGLVFQLKQAVGVETILNKEHYFTKKAIKRLVAIPNLHILGSLRVQRLPIFSFLIEHEQTGFYLHPNFVGALLNDLFGIQSRSGCACAGPYAQYLLGIDYSMSKLIEQCLVQDERIDRHHLRVRVESSNAECIRPGFTRLNFAFFMSESRVDFVLDAIEFVCRFGWQFLPHYVFNLETGEFRHRNFQVFRDRKWLGQINYKNGLFNYTRKVNNSKESINDCPKTDEECLANAYLILENIKQTMQIGDQRLIFSEQVSKFRWFLLPSEAYGILHEKESLYSREKIKPPFRPRRYNLDIEKDLNNLYDLKLVSTNGEEDKSTNSFDYSQFAETFYSDQDLERYIRVIQNDVKSELEKEASFHVRRYSHRNSSSSSYKEHHPSTASDTKEKTNHHPSIDESEEKLICQLKNKARVLSGEGKDGKTDQKWHNPPKHIFKPFVEAIKEFEMIKNGDKILVCLSGGKDSLSLLHAIRQYKYFAKSINIEFEFGAVTVDPKSPSYDPSSLKGYLAELNVPYFYEEQDILVTAENLPYECASICSFCSRMKRGRIYSTARQHGYNVLALGQHLDDVCESFMMSLFYNGRLWSMKASYENEDGDLRIIRPFVYVREKDLRAFAEQNHLPIIAENCPACFEAPKERHRMKQMLAQQELLFPNLFSSMLSAIKPIIGIGKCRLSVKALNEFALKMIKRNPDLYDELVKTSDSSESFVERNNEDDSF